MPNHASLRYRAASPCVRSSGASRRFTFCNRPVLNNALMPAGAINALQGQVRPAAAVAIYTLADTSLLQHVDARHLHTKTALLDLLQSVDLENRNGLLLQLNAGKLDKALPKKLRENLEKRLTVSACPGSLHGAGVPLPAMSIGCAVAVVYSNHAALGLRQEPAQTARHGGVSACVCRLHRATLQVGATACASKVIGCAAAVTGKESAACLPRASLHGNVSGWTSHLHCIAAAVCMSHNA